MRAFQILQTKLLAIPGVSAASVGLQLPDRGESLLSDRLLFLEVEGRPRPPSERRLAVLVTTQPGYFRALGIPLVAGRDFNDRDEGIPSVAIVNESLARTYFAPENPIGRRLATESWKFLVLRRTLEIVGVAGDVRHGGGAVEANPVVYLPLGTVPVWGSNVVVKTARDPLGFVNVVRTAVRSVDQDQPIYDIQTLDQRIGRSVAQDRFNSGMLAIFAALALMLALSGLYGVLSYVVTQRTHEIGIRICATARRPWL